MKLKNENVLGLFLFIACALVIVLLLGLAQRPMAQQSCPQPICPKSLGPSVPHFTSPAARLAELSNQNFTIKLYNEAVAYEPLLAQSGTQVHMGYWSGAGNHGSLVRVLDSINNYRSAPNESVQRAVWDEGTQSSLQYPDYVLMNAEEHWYERAGGVNGSVTIYGKNYTDPFPVTFQQADDIWGAYSKRYADMAVYFQQATGKPVQVWCFVQGARSNRVFYTYEYPELQRLEREGIVQVHFAKSQDADWKNPDDWYIGTENWSSLGRPSRQTTIRSIDIGGQNLSFRITPGRVDLPTILLESGQGADSAQWSAVQNTLALETDNPIVSYDRAGFGNSSTSAGSLGNYSIETEVAALETSLNRLNITGPFVYVAHSYGGFLAQMFAARNPQIVRAVVLADPNTVCFNDGGGFSSLWQSSSSNNISSSNLRIISAYPKTIETMLGVPFFSNSTSLIVISAGFPPVPAGNLTTLWRTCHKQLIQNNPTSEFWISANSSHNIPADDPNIIVAAIEKELG